MGANLSARKAASRDAEARWESCLGWRQVGQAWEAVDTPRGLIARKAVVKGHCGTGECGRRVSVDLSWWIEHGFGDVDLGIVKQAYVCGRIGCRLSFNQPTYPGGVPLMSFANDPTAKVTVECGFCNLRRERSVSGFVEAITKAGTGGPNLPAWDLRQTVRGECKRCGRATWRVSVSSKGAFVGPPPGLR